MACARFAKVFLGLLLSWLAVCESTSIAQIASATRSRDNHENMKVKDLHFKTERMRKMKLITGRKMRVFVNTISKPSVAKCGHEDHLSKECKKRVVTGEANKPPNKQVADSNKIRKNEKMKGDDLEPVEFSKTAELKEADNAIYSMMTGDYNLSAKAKPPINNHQTSDEVDKNPKLQKSSNIS